MPMQYFPATDHAHGCTAQKQVLPFIYSDHKVTTIVVGKGSPWWAAKEVCAILEVSNNRDGVKSLGDDEKKTGCKVF